jgi:DMSO reductase anchor subunit
MLRTVPAWNSWATPVTFVGTALGLGAAITAAAVAIEGRRPEALGPLAAFVAASSLLVWLVHLRRLGGQRGAAAESAAVVREGHPSALGLRIATGFAAAALLLVFAWPGREAAAPGVLAAAAVLLASEAIGRFLFYASHRRIGL